MKLIGSIASPYVRRIRIQLGKQDYQFEKVNVFDKADQKKLAKISPTKRVPVLIDGETVIWDSLLIAKYLNRADFDLETSKELVLINEMTDAGIQLFQLRKFEIDPVDSGVFSQNNLGRIQEILKYFEAKTLSEWNMVEQWLYCTLDWFIFRNVVDWRGEFPHLVEFYLKNTKREIIQDTAPSI